MSTIQYLQRHQIDTVKWDRCIERSPNGLIYAYSFYLDHMAKQWDALVMGDYEVVMPLPWNKKWGIRYVYTPPFIQRLGVWGNRVEADSVIQFYREAGLRFSFIDLMVDIQAMEMSMQSRSNFIIPLDQSYESIRTNYTEECTRNIIKAIKRGCVFTKEVAVDAVIALYRSTYGHYSPNYNAQVYERLAALATQSVSNDHLLSCGVTDANDGTLLFGAFIFHCNKRLYYIAGAPTAAGRQARATYFFIDQLLQQFAGSALVFDFEGSDIPEVAAFYQRFGPQQENYYHWYYNRLPWWVRWMK